MKKLKKHKFLLLSLILIVIIVALVVYVSTLYMKGDVSNYKPPQPTSASSLERVQSDLQSLSQAVDAYFIKNMEYPQNLEVLQPEFLDHMAHDPLTEKPYLYTLSETDGRSRYRIGVPDPNLYKLKGFYIEDGVLIQN